MSAHLDELKAHLAKLPRKWRPAPLERRTFRPWEGGKPPAGILNGTDGEVLSPRDQARIGKLAMRVWRHLLQLRGYESHALSLSYARVAADLGISDDAVSRAMQRLARVGLVDKWRGRISTRDGWASRLDVRVWGGLDLYRGRETAWVPVGVVARCVGMGRGGVRRGFKAAVRIDSRANFEDPNRAVADQSRAPMNQKRESTYECSLSSKENRPARQATFAASQLASTRARPPVDRAAWLARTIEACRQYEERVRACPPRLADSTPCPLPDAQLVAVIARRHRCPEYAELRLAELAEELAPRRRREHRARKEAA